MTDVFAGGGRMRGPQGIQGVQGDQGIQGVQGIQGIQGVQGNPGPGTVYNASGAVPLPKIWSGTVVTNASGVWTVDYTNAGFTATPRLTSSATNAGATAGTLVNTKTTSKSATGASGIAAAPALAVLGILSVSLVGAGVSIDVIAIGE